MILSFGNMLVKMIARPFSTGDIGSQGNSIYRIAKVVR